MTFNEFPPTSKSDWLNDVKKLSKGADVAHLLHYEPIPGVKVPAYSTCEDAFEKVEIVTEKQLPFKVCLPIDLNHKDWAEVIHSGVDSIALNDVLLIPEWLHFKEVHVRMEESEIQKLSLLEHQQAGGSICIKPGKDWDDYLSKITPLVNKPISGWRNLGIDIPADKNEVEQLEFAFSMANLFLRAREKPDTNSLRTEDIFFRMPLGSDFYMNLAKLRALKQGWYNLMSAYYLPMTEPFIIAETPNMNVLEKEMEQNLIVSTTLAFAAISGGASLFLINGLETLNNQSPDFALRMVRNIQLILKEESFTDSVSDPSKGSYFIENLTKELAEKAWEKFIEKQTD